MRQSTFIAVAIVIGFVVFVTMRGELKAYMKVLGLV